MNDKKTGPTKTLSGFAIGLVRLFVPAAILRRPNNKSQIAGLHYNIF